MNIFTDIRLAFAFKNNGITYYITSLINVDNIKETLAEFKMFKNKSLLLYYHKFIFNKISKWKL